MPFGIWETLRAFATVAATATRRKKMLMRVSIFVFVAREIKKKIEALMFVHKKKQ